VEGEVKKKQVSGDKKEEAREMRRRRKRGVKRLDFLPLL
jgi:hypothetical protein